MPISSPTRLSAESSGIFGALRSGLCLCCGCEADFACTAQTLAGGAVRMRSLLAAIDGGYVGWAGEVGGDVSQDGVHAFQVGCGDVD